jgi:hypothetical protein
MPKNRKLFITHASELAHRLVRAVRPDALIAEFAKSYALKHRRHGVVDHPARVRELEQTLGREAILVMLAEIHRILPPALGAGDGARDSEKAAFARMFQDEFEKALERALDWPPAEAAAEREAFARDLEIYERPPTLTNSGPDGSPQNHFSPFYDRCALLLDSSMMETARAAAAEFETHLASKAAEIVSQLGKPQSSPKPSRFVTRSVLPAKGKAKPRSTAEGKLKKKKEAKPKTGANSRKLAASKPTKKTTQAKRRHK